MASNGISPRSGCVSRLRNCSGVTPFKSAMFQARSAANVAMAAVASRLP